MAQFPSVETCHYNGAAGATQWAACAGGTLALKIGNRESRNIMSEHRATVAWQREAGTDFRRGRYSRRHQWQFDGGAVIAASPSPAVVPAPWSDASAVDPEEAFVAALASCHMLWFLSLAAERGWLIETYEDAALGKLERIAPERHAITEVTLRPRIAFAGTKPTAADIAALHERAHERCFIANSVTTRIRIESRD